MLSVTVDEFSICCFSRIRFSSKKHSVMQTINTAIRSYLGGGVGLLLLLAGSANGAETRPESSSGTSKRPVAAAASVPDACTFIPKAELERLVGRELRDGKQRTMPPGLFQCDFETPPQMYVTRRFDNPPLPEAPGFSSVTITTNPTSPNTFAESRRLMQADAEDVPGIGDGAYLNGPAMIYVRVGNRGFSIRLHVNTPSTAAGRTRLREVMLSLARAGVAKL
jgi:hypothetical protein